jgi:glycosyltransferase involved in cell wall biosynthesis
MVVAGSNWVKRDIVEQYGIHPDKVQIIPWAAPTQIHREPDESLLIEVAAKYALKKPYFYYPAMTWPHKNHLRLIEAFSRMIRKTATEIELVCSGSQKMKFWPTIESRVRELGLESRIRFLGMVPHEDLRPLYRGATAVIVPTLFEAASGPVFEAWTDSVPVACSNVTSLPEQVADAALVFNPYSVDAILDAMIRLERDGALRDRLVAAGRRRLSDFDWTKTAKAYRAVYRKIARKELSEEDRHLLSWDWMRTSSSTSNREG